VYDGPSQLETELFDTIGAPFNSLLDFHSFGVMFIFPVFFFKASCCGKGEMDTEKIIFSFAVTKNQEKKGIVI